MRPVRSAVKAVIIKDGQLLVLANVDEHGTWYMLPGGGQEPGETLLEALVRECGEEIGTTSVEIGPLLYVRDYIGNNHEFADQNPDLHQIELMFACSVPAEYAPGTGSLPDAMQTGVCWIPLTDLTRVRFFPKALVPYLLGDRAETSPTVYLGDVN